MEATTRNLRYTYRLRVSATAERELLAEWDRCRWVWNQCVVESRLAHQAKTECGPARLDRMLTGWRRRHEWLNEGASVPQQQIIRDFGTSRVKALKGIKNRLPPRQRPGMPRLKKKSLAPPSLNYTLRGFRIKEGRLHLAGGIVVSPVWSRGLPESPTSARVYRDSIGHWYVSFVVKAAPETLPVTGRAIGIDWGVSQIATTTSDLHDLPHPQHGKKAAAKLARYQRTMARRRRENAQPQSKGYLAAKHKVAKVHKKVARQRRDGARKWAKAVARDHDVIAVEDLRPKFLARSTLARKAADAAIGAAKQALIEMAQKHSRDLRLVHPAHTTTDCAQCGARAKHALPLSQRTYFCTTCGTSRPRDKNSAHVMLIRAGLNPAGVDRVRPGPPPAGQAA